MSEYRPTFVIEPDELEPRLGEPGLVVADLGRAETYRRYHIPGAVFLEYTRIVATRPPTGGLLPTEEQLSQALGEAGIGPDTHVVAYDDEGGGKAGRLIWTLDAIGHRAYSLLNGGLHAWANERHRLTDEATPVQPRSYPLAFAHRGDVVADTEYILDHLDDPDVVFLDTRSPDEYNGLSRFSERAGRIPGAVNLNWIDAMDQQRNLRLKAPGELRRMLEARGVTPDKTVVVYCQTHHRSAHTYVMLKALGYPDVRGYPGSWSEWGNRADTPVE